MADLFKRHCRRWIVAAIAIVMPAAILHAALPTEPEVSGRTSFAGQLLIASPSLRDPFDRAIDLRITRLRRKIEFDPAHPNAIRTVRGVGYMFVPSTEY